MPITCHVTYKTGKKLVQGECAQELVANIQSTFGINNFTMQLYETLWEDWLDIEQNEIKDRMKLRVLPTGEVGSQATEDDSTDVGVGSCIWEKPKEAAPKQASIAAGASTSAQASHTAESTLPVTGCGEGAVTVQR